MQAYPPAAIYHYRLWANGVAFWIYVTNGQVSAQSEQTEKKLEELMIKKKFRGILNATGAKHRKYLMKPTKWGSR